MTEGLAGRLQHPRRSLGDRHRTQATKFLRLIEADPERAVENSEWAEQNARQALLYDFTHPDNWRVLADIKVRSSDEIGLRGLLSDLFAVLGRDPEQMNQLDGVPILDIGMELLEAALIRDHLDPNLWFQSMDKGQLEAFCERFSQLDLTDPRCNVLFGRRVERMWESHSDDVCIPLARLLLSNRPQNFEMWADLGRAHERRKAYDEAWLCYDQAQAHAPHLDLRDSFRKRMETQIQTGERLPWNQPSIEIRDQFLSKMQSLATRFVTEEVEIPQEDINEVTKNLDEVELKKLLNKGEYAAAFFLSRRLLTRGELWVETYLEQAQKGLDSDDNIHIP
jgi:hypothetical protein